MLDASAVDTATVAARLSRALSGPRERAVVWIEGFVQGSAVLLLRDDALFGMLDSWVDGLSDDD